MKLIVTRDVTLEECPWLSKAIRKGTTVYEFNGHTYGARSTTGLFVSDREGHEPFYELPCTALENEFGNTVCAKYMAAPVGWGQEAFEKAKAALEEN